MLKSKQGSITVLLVCGTAFNTFAAIDSSVSKAVSPVSASSISTNDDNGLSVPPPDVLPNQNHATTALDQPNDKADIETAASVRRALVHDKALSTRAHNITVTAAAGVVTLGGYVNDPNEKAMVEAVARRVKSVAQVVNQLQIKQQ